MGEVITAYARLSPRALTLSGGVRARRLDFLAGFGATLRSGFCFYDRGRIVGDSKSIRWFTQSTPSGLTLFVWGRGGEMRWVYDRGAL